MRIEFIDRVDDGEVLGRNIFNNNGQILLKAGTRLNENYLKELKRLGVFYLYIEDDRLSDVEAEDPMLNELKQEAMKDMLKVYRNLGMSSSRSVNEKNFDRVNNLVDYIISMGDVNKSLYDIKTYDNYTYVHCLDTGIMSVFLGMSMGLKENQLKELAMGSILHDIGKTRVPSKIINKNGKLTKEEYDEIKKHPLYGREILKKNYWISDNVLKTVEQHHERIDGKGYPYGLKGKSISKFGKIASICDMYDAVSSDRSYRKKFSPNDAYELVMAGSGSAFDQKIIDHFKNTFSVYPLGSHVKLSNNIEGYVIRQNKGFPDKPVVRVFYDENRELIPFYEIDLTKQLNVVIKSII